MTPTLILLGILLSLVGLLYFRQERLIFLPESLPPDYRFEFPREFEEIEVPVAGARLHGLLFHASKPRGVVFYLHGNAGSMEGWGWVSELFLPFGFDVFILDYRGYGKSTGRVTSQDQFLDDAATAYEVVRKRYPAQDIILYGRSIGTGPAVWLAREQAPRMLILEAPYYSLRETAQRQFCRLVPGFLCRFPLPTCDWIADVTCPTYFIHGTRDELIEHDASQRLAELVHAPHEVFLIEGGHHNDLSEYDGYAEALARILGTSAP